ncbi:hypothetical protein CDD83_520 [Cordyceps sp. RAO-2017]|nr:hypothetical protein CDD83_520 [Cordyceps sp. RAO-2017]
MMEWAVKQGLLEDDNLRQQAARGHYGFLISRCYPNAEYELLQAIANYFIWFFLCDDLFIDRVESVTSETLRNLTSVIDVLDFDSARPEPVYGELAWLDICRRFRRLLDAEHFERFAQGMRLWASSAGLQILHHLRAESIGMREYRTIRRHTGGMDPCTSLQDVANHGPIDASEFHDYDIQKLRHYANNVVCWSNDVHSLIVEAYQPGQFRNMVTIRAAEGFTLQESMDYVAACVEAEIARFVELSNAILPHANTRVAGMIAGLQDSMRGYQDWVEQDTLRYAPEFIMNDADDRGRIVLPSRTREIVGESKS